MACALDGLTVLDLGSGPAAALATMFLGDNGARVVRLVAPGNTAPARGRLHRLGPRQGVRDARSRCGARGNHGLTCPAGRHAGGGVRAPRCRRRRAGGGLRARLAAAAPRRVAAPAASQSAPRGLLDHRLRQARTLEGRAADRGPGAGAHGPPVGHAGVPTRAGARGASAAQRRRGAACRQRHRRRAAGARDHGPRPRGRDLADGGRAAVSDQGHGRAARPPRVPDASLRQRSVLQHLPLRRRPVGAARLRAHRLHHDVREGAGDRRSDCRAALQDRARRSGAAGRCRAARHPHPHPAVQALCRVGCRLRGRRRALRAGAPNRGGPDRPAGSAQPHGHHAGGSGRRAGDADGRADPPERDAGPCRRSPARRAAGRNGPAAASSRQPHASRCRPRCGHGRSIRRRSPACASSRSPI